MPDPQLTPAQFAASIKEKYPQYKAVPDEQLARAMVDKYPQYAKQVSFGPAKLGAKGEAPALSVSAPPKTGTKDWLKSKAYTWADRLLPMLPAAGATAGALAVGPESGFLASPAGAMEGAVIMEGARNVLSRAIFPKDVDPERHADETDAAQEARRIRNQAALGFGTEFGARGVGAIGSKIARPFEASAATVRSAKAGEGVRMTPGEASGSRFLQRGEHALGHLPGGGPIQSFRAAQEGDATVMFQKQLDSLSTQRLSDYDTGKAVQKIVADTRSAMQKEIADRRTQLLAQRTAHYDEVKQLLGVDSKTFMSPREIDEAIAKKIEFYKQMGGGTPAVVEKLQAAKNFTRESAAALKQPIAGQVETKLIQQLMQKEPERVGDYLLTAGIDKLGEFHRLVPEPVRQQAAANVLQRMITQATDAQTHIVDQRAFAKSLQKLTEGRGRLIFGKQYNAIREGSELLNRIAPMGEKPGGLAQMHTLKTLIEVGSVAGTALSLSGHLPTAVMAVTGPVLAFRMIATALAHPQASAAVLKFMRAAAVTSTRAVPYAVDEIAAPNYKDTYVQAPTP